MKEQKGFMLQYLTRGTHSNLVIRPVLGSLIRADLYYRRLPDSVTDPYSLNLDPDPAKNLNPDPVPDSSFFLTLSEIFFHNFI